MKNIITVISILFIIFAIIGGINYFLTNENTVTEMITQIQKISQYKILGISQTEAFLSILSDRLKLLAFVWCTGMTIIGVLTIPMAISIEGFSIGYSIALIAKNINQLSEWKAILVNIASNIIIILPLLIILSGSSTRFSLFLLKNKDITDIKYKITGHSIIMLIITLIVTLQTFLETNIYYILGVF